MYRWYVFVGKIRYVTWAETTELAIAKVENRYNVKRLRLKADRVEPAPPAAL
jgi:hypothetical protein